MSEFKYLGTTFTENERMDREIEIRCPKAKQALGQLSPILQHNAVPIKVKKKHLIQIVFIPTLCYQCQILTLKQNHRQKLVTTEMRSLRRDTGISLKDKQPNEKVRNRLVIETVLQFIKRPKIKWLDHLRRMHINSIPCMAYNEQNKRKTK
jgi:hypothetical protein